MQTPPDIKKRYVLGTTQYQSFWRLRVDAWPQVWTEALLNPSSPDHLRLPHSGQTRLAGVSALPLGTPRANAMEHSCGSVSPGRPRAHQRDSMAGMRPSGSGGVYGGAVCIADMRR